MPRRSRPRRVSKDWSQVPNMVTALTAVGALVFTGLSLQATRDQMEIARHQELTARFTTAVEHLGDDRTVDVRLGAVLALERIAGESAGDRDSIGQLLAAFVRRRRPLDGCVQDHGYEADVTAAVRVVSTERLVTATDLSSTCLSGDDLHGARLRCAMLEGTNLSGTTNLVGADLRQANLTGALLGGPDPTDPAPIAADLSGADLRHARVLFADLSHTLLVGADLRGADLMNANLRGADLTGVRWAGAYIGHSTFDSHEARATAIAGGAVDDVGGYRPRPCMP